MPPLNTYDFDHILKQDPLVDEKFTFFAYISLLLAGSLTAGRQQFSRLTQCLCRDHGEV